MKVLVLGAAGKTGSAVVNQALAAGHQVTAFVHDADDYDRPGDVTVAAGDAADPAAVEAAVAGQDAVVDTIGGRTPYKSDITLEDDAVRTVIAAMRQHGVRRLVTTSMIGEGDSAANATGFAKLLLKTALRGATEDKANMEASVEASGLDWVIVRPAILNDDPATGQVSTYDPDSGTKAHKITRADLAAFLVGQLTSAEHLGRAVTVANS